METNHESKKTNVYQLVTVRILQALTRGEIPWRQTWTARKGQKHPFTNHFTGKPYGFLNTLLLGTPGEYATFNQIKEKGGHIRKGAKSYPVIYWGEYIPKENRQKAKELEEKGEDISHLKVPFPKYYRVFNILDAEELREKPRDEQAPMQAAQAPTDIADMAAGDYRASQGVKVVEDVTSAPAWDAPTDTVSIPPKKAFTYEEDYYAALFSQFVHSTCTPGRCNRKAELEKLSTGQEMTVKEELTAEIGSSMILSATGLERKQTHDQIAAECKRWIEILNKDYRLIIGASSAAEKAAKLILGEFAI